MTLTKSDVDKDPALIAAYNLGYRSNLDCGTISQEDVDRDLRDQFAMSALNGMCAYGPMVMGSSDQSFANQAYKFADAMLGARKK